MHEPISRIKLKDQVVERLLERISSGEVGPGERLPTERELVESLGVSRTVVREAINLLEARGIVRVTQGRGAVVSANDGQAVRDALETFLRVEPGSLWELLEVRRMLEVEVAAVAAERATPGDTASMRVAIERMEAKIERPEGYVEADVEFHALLARSARNRVLLTMIEPIAELLRASRQVSASRPGGPLRALREHKEILGAVEDQDASRASRKMREHLAATERDIMSALNEGGMESPSRAGKGA